MFKIGEFSRLRRLNRILALRDLGLSFGQISGLLGENLPATDLLVMLKHKRDELEHQIHTEQYRLER